MRWAGRPCSTCGRKARRRFSSRCCCTATRFRVGTRCGKCAANSAWRVGAAVRRQCRRGESRAAVGAWRRGLQPRLGRGRFAGGGAGRRVGGAGGGREALARRRCSQQHRTQSALLGRLRARTEDAGGRSRLLCASAPRHPAQGRADAASVAQLHRAHGRSRPIRGRREPLPGQAVLEPAACRAQGPGLRSDDAAVVRDGGPRDAGRRRRSHPADPGVQLPNGATGRGLGSRAGGWRPGRPTEGASTTTISPWSAA